MARRSLNEEAVQQAGLLFIEAATKAALGIEEQEKKKLILQQKHQRDRLFSHTPKHQKQPKSHIKPRIRQSR